MKLIGYEWRLRELMAARGIFSTTKLIPLLRERGVTLSASQVYRLAAEKPERLNLHVLMALLDILGCSAEELIKKIDLGEAAATGTDSAPVTDSPTAVIKEKGFRPVRMTVRSPHDV